MTSYGCRLSEKRNHPYPICVPQIDTKKLTKHKKKEKKTMSQILTNIEGILKDKYQPALSNLINIEPSPFLEMIRKEPLQNNKVRMAAPIGLNGGFGFGAEGASTPASAEQRYLDFELNAVDMYVDMQISNKTVVLGSSNTGSMINALDAEIKGSYAAAKWNLGRALFGDGSGILCHFNPMDDAAAELTVDDTGKLMEGILVVRPLFPDCKVFP